MPLNRLIPTMCSSRKYVYVEILPETWDSIDYNQTTYSSSFSMLEYRDRKMELFYKQDYWKLYKKDISLFPPYNFFCLLTKNNNVLKNNSINIKMNVYLLWWYRLDSDMEMLYWHEEGLKRLFCNTLLKIIDWIRFRKFFIINQLLQMWNLIW